MLMKILSLSRNININKRVKIGKIRRNTIESTSVGNSKRKKFLIKDHISWNKKGMRVEIKKKIAFCTSLVAKKNAFGSPFIKFSSAWIQSMCKSQRTKSYEVWKIRFKTKNKLKSGFFYGLTRRMAACW